jgi:alkylation response protein AidB-like acyl-CoA dehydrogenase
VATPEPALAETTADLRTPAEVGDEVRRWVHDSWNPDLCLLEWRARLADAGWACPTWPAGWGGLGLPVAFAEVVANALAELGVPGPPESVGMHLAAPTLIEHGSDDLNKRFLRSTATGEIVWCQLFSEPAAGSDLAGLVTRAERDGDEWVVSGQKVWNTGAAQADFGLLLARTDWDVPKHQGLTYFILPMRQSSIDVRPLRQMNGHASFNEVFLDDARLPTSNVVGEVGGGWRAALTTLAHERRLASSRRNSTAPGPVGRAWQEALAEQRAATEPHKWYPQRAGRVDLLTERALATGTSTDPIVRQEIATVLSAASAAKWTAQRTAAARRLGRPPGPEGSLGKLATSNIARAASHAHSVMAGASGMLAGADAPLGGTITEIFVSVPGQSIAGGTDEIQHNIIAERILGLPKESSSDLQMPFREVSRNGG